MVNNPGYITVNGIGVLLDDAVGSLPKLASLDPHVGRPDGPQYGTLQESLKVIHNVDDARRVTWDFGVGYTLNHWPKMRELGYGQLFWPWGATRCSFIHLLINDSIWSDILKTMTDPTKPFDPVALVMSDGSGSVTAAMYLTPPVALSSSAAQPVSDRKLYRLTLVDQRAFWWFKPDPNATAPDNWGDLFSAYGVTAEAVDGAWGVPHGSILKEGNYAEMLDAIANSVGQRIVCSLSGAVSSITAGTSSLTQAQYGLVSGRIGGGPALSASIGIPRGVSVVYPVYGLRGATERTWTEERTNNDGNLNWTQVYTTTAQAYFDESNNPLNEDEVNSHADAVSAAVAAWAGSRFGGTWERLVSLTPNAHNDAIIWEYSSRQVRTRACEAPLEPMNSQVLYNSFGVDPPSHSFFAIINGLYTPGDTTYYKWYEVRRNAQNTAWAAPVNGLSSTTQGLAVEFYQRLTPVGAIVRMWRGSAADKFEAGGEVDQYFFNYTEAFPEAGLEDLYYHAISSTPTALVELANAASSTPTDILDQLDDPYVALVTGGPTGLSVADANYYTIEFGAYLNLNSSSAHTYVGSTSDVGWATAVLELRLNGNQLFAYPSSRIFCSMMAHKTATGSPAAYYNYSAFVHSKVLIELAALDYLSLYGYRTVGYNMTDSSSWGITIQSAYLTIKPSW